MVRFPFYKRSITFNCYRCCYYFVFTCFYSFKNERNLPFVFTKKYMPKFSCPEKKAMKSNFAGAILFQMYLFKDGKIYFRQRKKFSHSKENKCLKDMVHQKSCKRRTVTINPLAPRNEQNINSPQFQYILWQTSDEKRQLYHPQGCYVDVLPNSPQ